MVTVSSLEVVSIFSTLMSNLEPLGSAFNEVVVIVLADRAALSEAVVLDAFHSLGLSVPAAGVQSVRLVNGHEIVEIIAEKGPKVPEKKMSIKGGPKL